MSTCLRLHPSYRTWTASNFNLSYRSIHSLLRHVTPTVNKSLTLQQGVVKRVLRYSGTLPGAPAAPPTTWVDRLPRPVRPYLYLTRIDKPIGTLLLFYPCSTCFLASLVRVLTLGPILSRSMVHYDGIVRVGDPVHDAFDVHQPVWTWCTRYARGGVHHQ